MILCAGQSEQFNFATPIGIGMIEVAINLTQLILLKKPDFLLFVGSAGSYGNQKIFDIIEVKNASNIENSFFNASAYSPIENKILSSDYSIDIGVPRGTFVNSSNYITTDKSLGKFYIKEGIEIENMEYYSIAKVAEKFNIPVRGIFIITNYCDENAHQYFIKNHQKSIEKLTKYIINTNKEKL